MARFLPDRFWTSPLLMGWMTLMGRVVGNAVVLVFLTTRLSSAQIALWLTLLAVNTMFLGADLGLNRLMTRMIAYGLGGAAVGDLAAPFAPVRAPERGANWDTIRHIYRQQQTLMAVLAAAALVFAAIFGTWLIAPRVAALGVQWDGWIAWAILLANGTIGLQGVTYASFLNGVDRVALVQRCELFFVVAGQAGAIAVLALHGSLAALALAWMGPDMANVALNRVLARRVHARALGQPRWMGLDSALIAELWPQAWRAALGALTYQLAFSAAPLLLVRSADATRAAQFLFSLRAVKVIDGFAASPFVSYLPRLARLRFAGDAPAFRRLAERGVLAAFAVLIGVGIPAGFFARSLLTHIGSHAKFVGPALFFFWLIGIGAMRYGFMHLQLVLLSNRVRHHIGYSVSGGMFVAALALFREEGPARAYGIALAAAAFLFFVPYALVLSYPQFDAVTRRNDAAIAGASLLLLLAAWGLAAGF